ncbi:unnamed protein product, partial [Pocillopora meandrina]
CTGDITCGNGCCRNNPCLNGGTALKSVSPRVLGTTVPVQSRLLGNIARLDWEVVRITKQLGITHLDCTQSLMEDLVFYDDYRVINGDTRNWQAYLIKRPYLLWLTDHSTHWRATCRYNTDNLVYTDYLKASLEDFDIIRDEPRVRQSCRRCEYVNIRGNECVNCTARTWYEKGHFPLLIDSSIQGDCDFNGNMPNAAVPNEDNFGLYNAVNPKFRCTQTKMQRLSSGLE